MCCAGGQLDRSCEKWSTAQSQWGDEYTKVKVKVDQSLYWPAQALRVPGGWGSHISIQSAHEGGKVVSHTHRPPLTPRKYSWYSFLLEAESTPRATVRPEGLCHWKILVTPPGIEPATFRFVAQCLDQLRKPHTPKRRPTGLVISYKRRKEVTGRRGRSKQLLGDLNEKCRYRKLKKKAVDRTVSKIRFGGPCSHVRQTTE